MLENMVACYRATWRKKKWCLPLYAWSLNVCAVNAWRLKSRHTKKNEPFLPFLREAVQTMLREQGTIRVLTKRNMQLPSTTAEQHRLNNIAHWPNNTE